LSTLWLEFTLARQSFPEKKHDHCMQTTISRLHVMSVRIC